MQEIESERLTTDTLRVNLKKYAEPHESQGGFIHSSKKTAKMKIAY